MPLVMWQGPKGSAQWGLEARTHQAVIISPVIVASTAADDPTAAAAAEPVCTQGDLEGSVRVSERPLERVRVRVGMRRSACMRIRSCACTRR